MSDAESLRREREREPWSTLPDRWQVLGQANEPSYAKMGEFFRECFIAVSQRLRSRRIAVISNYCWNRCRINPSPLPLGFGYSWRNSGQQPACCTLAKPRKEFMIPQTVPNRPT